MRFKKEGNLLLRIILIEDTISPNTRNDKKDSLNLH